MNDDHAGALAGGCFGAALGDDAAFAARAASRLRSEPQDAATQSGPAMRSGPDRGGDWDINPELRAEPLMQAPARPAAVLLPVIARGELTVLMTLRRDHLPAHAGQISFPGGKIEDHDDGPMDAALRETEEEIGLGREHISALGFLDGYRTATGFHITPLVGLVRPGFVLKLDAREVAEVFEVPLRYLMDEANHQRHSRPWRGQTRSFYAINYEGRCIWGATAAIVMNLYERLSAR